MFYARCEVETKDDRNLFATCIRLTITTRVGIVESRNNTLRVRKWIYIVRISKHNANVNFDRGNTGEKTQLTFT